MKRFPFLLLIPVLLLLSCARREIRFVPGPGQSVEVLSLKFLLSQENGRQTGKIRWKFAAGTSTALFLSPINQVLFELYARGENVLLINRRERVYWEGDFLLLIQRYWNLGLKLREIRQIVADGVVPDSLSADPSFRIELFRGPDRTVERVEIRKEKSRLILRVLKRDSIQGKIIPPSDMGKFGRRDLVEDVIGHV